ARTPSRLEKLWRDCSEPAAGWPRLGRARGGVRNRGSSTPAAPEKYPSCEAISVDFSWTEEQQALRNEITRFARQELNDNLIERDHDSEFSREGWKKCAQIGIQGLPVPEEYGGGGADILTTVCALEALGYGCQDNGLIFSINAHMWTSEIPLMSFGTEAQKKYYLPKLVSGEWVGIGAMTEPMAGSDAYSLKTRAERKGDRYVLNGSKTFITNAPNADVTIVFANLD